MSAAAKRKLDSEEFDISSLVSILKCPYCSAVLLNPKQLPECGHCFCYTCLLKLKEKGDAESKSDSQRAVVCPACQTSNTLGPLGLEGIPTNVPLLAICNQLRKLQRTKPTVTTVAATPAVKTEPAKKACFENNGELDGANEWLPAAPSQQEVRSESSAACSQFEKLRCQSSASTHSDAAESVAAPPCCSFYTPPKPRAFCHHCKTQFCKRCELLHLEQVKNEVAQFGTSLTERLSKLPNANDLSIAASDAFNKLQTELERVEKEVTQTAMTAYSTISRALGINGERLVEEANNSVHEETQRMEMLVKKWSREEWRADVIKQITEACKGIKTKSVLQQSLDSVSTIFYYLSKLEDDVGALERILRPPEEAQIMFITSPEFTDSVNNLGSSLPMGSISVLSKAETFTVAEKVSTSSTPAPTSITPCPTVSHNFDKTFYENLRVTANISGTDCLSWDFRKPTGICVVPGPDEMLAAVIHNGTRVSLVSPTGDLVATYRIRLSPEEGEDCVYLGHDIAATESGTIFLTCHLGLRITFFSYPAVTTPRSVYARVLVRAQPDCTFSGLAISEKRQEIYTSTRDAIVAYFIRDGVVSFRCAFQDPAQIGTSCLRTAFMDDTSTHIIYTSLGSKVAYEIRLPHDEPLSSCNAAATRLPFTANSTDQGSRIRCITPDPVGNLLVSYANLGRIKIYAPNSSLPVTVYAPSNVPAFDPERFVILNGSTPVVIVSCFHSSSVMILSP